MSPFLRVAKRVRDVVRIRRLVKGPRRPSWDENFETLATMLHHYGQRSYLLPLRWQRVATNTPAVRTDMIRGTRFEPVRAGGVEAEFFRRPESDESRLLIYLHGGGYSIGSLDSHRDLIARMCEESGALTLGVDYRLAPEHRFPAQLEDSMAVYRWVLDQGFDPARITLAGESAGGGLTISTLVKIRDERMPLPAAAVCISPWVDLEGMGGTMRTNAPFDYVGYRVIRSFARRFVRHEDLRHPYAAPLYADLSGLPPLLIQAGGAETLLDDSVRLAERARRAGVDVSLEVATDMIHAWHLFAPAFEQPRNAIRRAGSFIREHSAGEKGSIVPSAAP